MPDRAEALLKRLDEIARRDSVTAADLEQIRHETQPESSSESARSPGLRTQPRMTAGGIDVWVKYRRGEPLNPQDIVTLESIVLGNGLRPAFDIQNGSYATLPSIWQPLNQQRALLNPIIASIGRIELTGHPSTTLGGTAFVCGDSLVMTNRHAAQTFVQGIGMGATLSFVPGISADVDFIEEIGNTASLPINITAPVVVLEEWDVAILRLADLPNSFTPLPMVSSQPGTMRDVMASIVGYPSFDPRDSVVSQLEIFRGVFDKKRLQPGMLRGMKPALSFGRTVAALAHDCSTIGGNSGSALIAVDTGRVVGIHFGGQPEVANFSVPTWELAANPVVRDTAIQFVS
jgi:endonuclease G, mitochondrial